MTEVDPIACDPEPPVMPTANLEPSAHATQPRPSVGDTARWRRLQNVVNARLFGDEPPRVGRYRLLQSLGSGAMGVVFSALDTELQRTVAIKLLSGEPGDEQRRRLQREAQAMARVDHPNVVGVYDVGESHGELYVAMELVTGQTLRAWLDASKGRRHWRETVAVFAAAARGMAAAHAAGLVHRDFKPENVLISESASGIGRVCVVDFGLVTRGEGSSDPLFADRVLDDPHAPTPTSIAASIPMAGTPAYMAPEQVQGRPVDARADVWSFCVTLFEALYGERPFDREGVPATLAAVMAGEIRWPPRRASVPARLERLLRLGLQVDRDRRSLDTATIANELDKLLAARRRRLIGLGGAVAVASVAALAVRAFAGPASACDDPVAALGSAWDDARRRAVVDRIGTHSQSSPADVGAALDDYAGRWRRQFESSCATDEHGREALAQRLCLDAQRGELDASTTILAGADLAIGRNVEQVLTALADPALCGDPSRRPASFEETPSTEVSAWRFQIARARALWNAGDEPQAKLVARAVFDAAHAAGAWAVAADAGVLYGQVAFVAFEDLREKVPIVEQARDDANRAAHAAAAARASALLVHAPVDDSSELAGRFSGALGHAESVGDAEALAILGLAAAFSPTLVLGLDDGEAERIRARARELAAERLGAGHRLTRALEDPRPMSRRIHPAVAAAEQALRDMQNQWGTDSGEAGKAHVVLAGALGEEQRWDEAIAAQRTGVALLHAVHGNSGVVHTRALVELARMHVAAGELETGIDVGMRAIAAMRVVAPDPRVFAHTHQDIALELANLLVADGQSGRALELAADAADRDDRSRRLPAAALLAELLLRTGDLDGAQHEIDLAWTIVDDPDPELWRAGHDIGRLRLVRGLLHLARGAHREAAEEFHFALPNLHLSMARDHVIGYDGLARCALARGDEIDARLQIARAMQFASPPENQLGERDPAIVQLRETEATVTGAVLIRSRDGAAG